MMDMLQGINPLDLLKSGFQSISGMGGGAEAGATQGSAATGGVDFAKIIMSQIDTDGDGKISTEEMNAGAEKLKGSLSQLNGVSSQMRAHSANSQNTADTSSMISLLDGNGNSTLDITETSLTQGAFSKIDIDGNGQISSAELTAIAGKANGTNASDKIKATQQECVSLLSELQAKGAAKQYETTQSTAKKAA